MALLAKAKPRKRRESDSRALVHQRGETRDVAPRRMFSDVQEPLGTLLRIGVLGFGFGGWAGMAAIRLSLTIVVWTAALLVFPKRKKITGVGGELDEMLAEGQGGFTDMMKGAMARR